MIVWEAAARNACNAQLMTGYSRTVLTCSAHHCCSLSAAYESPFSKYCRCTICAQIVFACLSGHLDMIHGAQILGTENTVSYWGAGVWYICWQHQLFHTLKKTTMLSFHCANDTLLLCAWSCYQDSCTIFEILVSARAQHRFRHSHLTIREKSVQHQISMNYQCCHADQSALWRKAISWSLCM